MLELTAVSLLNGVVYGLLLFMLTSGLTLIFSMMGVLNFAHASVFMLARTSRSSSAAGSDSGPRSCWRRLPAA
jgi:branched-subunit amino acid ABC-type transport system permease component